MLEFPYLPLPLRLPPPPNLPSNYRQSSDFVNALSNHDR
jgi:hypothetical protein